jgi:hypothetical protein
LFVLSISATCPERGVCPTRAVMCGWAQGVLCFH